MRFIGLTDGRQAGGGKPEVLGDTEPSYPFSQAHEDLTKFFFLSLFPGT